MPHTVDVLGNDELEIIWYPPLDLSLHAKAGNSATRTEKKYTDKTGSRILNPDNILKFQ